MRAMILAAGRGERMGHLTADVPKALLRLDERYLIEYSIRALTKIGVQEIVINVCYKAEKIKSALGSGEKYNVKIIYSDEVEALETGGGIFQALPLLGGDPFIVVACDIVADINLAKLPKHPDKLAHLVLVNNPDFYSKGDYCLAGNKVYLGEDKTYTFASIGVYRPELFAGYKPGKFRLGDVLKQAIQNDEVTGECYNGFWQNFGTPSQLENKVALPDSLL